ncbi:hypothetical protein D3C72_239650 [compost metagenome]
MRAPALPGMLVALLTSGCVYLPLTSIPQFTSAELANGSVSVTLDMAVKPGGYRNQTLILPFTIADVDHVTLHVFKLTGNHETPVVDTVAFIGQPLVRPIRADELRSPITLTRLAQSTTYRLRAKAYRSAGGSATELISQDAGSFIDVAVGTDDRPVAAALPVVLVDRLFSGESTSSFQFIDGQVVDAGPESIQ